MKKAKIYQYTKCSTCRDAVKSLKRLGYELESVEVFDQPPSAEELAELARLSGVTVDKLFNVAGEAYRELKLKDRIKQMPDDEKLRLLASNGRLIKRPLVTDGAKATVGYKEDHYQQTWS